MFFLPKSFRRVRKPGYEATSFMASVAYYSAGVDNFLHDFGMAGNLPPSSLILGAAILTTSSSSKDSTALISSTILIMFRE